MTTKRARQQPLLDLDDLEDDNSWRQEWQGMPEFLQEDLTSHRSIIVHFRNDEDVQAFARLVGQKITAKQPSLWYPKMEPRRYAHLLWVDENGHES